MSRPRRIVPNSTQLLTRRCTQRMFLLRPDKRTTAILNYCLAEAAKRCRIELIAWVFMSNHYHAVVHDRYGCLPKFTERFHKLIAKALNKRWLRRENFWSTQETNLTLLPTNDDVLRKVVYVLTNPTKANLIDSIAHYPGASSWSYMDNRPRSHARPAYFNRKKKTATSKTSKRPTRGSTSSSRKTMTSKEMPKRVSLRAALPPASMSGEPRWSADKWRALVRERVLEKEKEYRAARKRDGINVVGKHTLMTQSHELKPATPEERCKVRPTLACLNKELRKQWRETISQFHGAYQRARYLWARNIYRVRFPAGTYRMRLLGALCTPLPD